MAPHSSTFAWKIPWMQKPGRLQSMGFRRSAGLLGRPAAAAPVYGHTTLNAPDLGCPPPLFAAWAATGF